MADPDGFWLDAAGLLDWNEAPSAGLGEDGKSWFPGGHLNICYNAVDRHVLGGRGEDRALIYESPVTSTRQTFTFSELQDEVARTAGMLAELGWPALASCIGLGCEPAPIGAAGYPVPGFKFEVLYENGLKVGAGKTGNLCIKEPLAPGSFRSLWRNQEGFDGYFTTFPGYYATGDAGELGEDGAFRVMGRTDDIINVAGHRLSTGQIEEVVSSCPAVVECAVIGGHDELKGEVPVVFYVRSARAQEDTSASNEIRDAVRGQISRIASPRDIISVSALPKTRSGKILRNLLRAILNGEDYSVPQTIEDAGVISQIIAAVRKS